MEHTDLNDFFVSTFQKGNQRITDGERRNLHKRKQAIDNAFTFSQDNILKLQRVNSLLHKEERAVLDHVNRVRDLHSNWLNANLIVNFELEVVISLFSSRYNDLHPDFDNNAFFTDSLPHFGSKNDQVDNIDLTQNRNEFQLPNHGELSLFAEAHCRTFYHLHAYTYLSWDDICNIEDILIEVGVRNQFLIDLNKY